MFPFHISYAIKMFNSILVNINYLQCWFFTWSVYDNALVSATLFWISLWKEAQHLSVHKGDNRQREPSRQWHGGKPHTSDTPQVFSDGQPAGAEALRQSATLRVQHRDTRFCLHSYTHTLNWCLHTTVSPNILPVSDRHEGDPHKHAKSLTVWNYRTEHFGLRKNRRIRLQNKKN